MFSWLGPVSKCFLSLCLKRNLRLWSRLKRKKASPLSSFSSATLNLSRLHESSFLETQQWDHPVCFLPTLYSWIEFLCSQRFFFQSSVPVKMPEVCYIIGRQQERTLAEIDIFPHPSRFSSTKLKLCKCDASQDCFLFFPAMGASCVQRQPHQRSATPRDGMHLQKTKTWCMLLATALTSTMLISF